MAIAQTDLQRTAPPYTLIVFIFLTVLLAAGAVWMYLKWDKSQKDLADLQQQQDSLLKASEARDKIYQDVMAEALKAKGSPSALNYLLAQRSDLRSSLVGAPDLSNADIQSKIDAALKAAQSSLGPESSASLSALPMVEVIQALTGSYDAQRLTASTAEARASSAEASAQQAQQRLQQLQITAEKNLAKLRSDVQVRWDKLDQFLKDWDANLAKLQADLAVLRESLRSEKELAQQKAEAMQQKLADSKKRLQSLIDKVQQWRGESGIEFAGMITKADGKVVKIVPAHDLVLIDIGQGEHLPLSLKFEVFSPAERITERTKSKATIQVVQVRPKISQCQIVRTAPGQVIMLDDVIVNSVYDRKNSYVFRVIGEFDIDGDGKPDIGGAKSLESLIERWGGQAVDDLHVQTDFLVLGDQPQTPVQPDIFDQAAVAFYEQKRKELAAYMDEQDRAVDLSIPILNHRRFVYLLGLGDRSELDPMFSAEADLSSP